MIDERNIFVFDDNEGVADYALIKWIEISSQAIEDRGSFTAALSGGKTPVEFYKRLAASRNTLSWDMTYLFLVDERFVPPSHRESNYGLIERYLLSHVNISDANVHRLQTEGITLEESARRYEEDIRSFFRIEGGSVPQFDLIILGIGEDGHTASLFPGTGLLRVTERLALPVTAGRVPAHRISLSLPVLTNGRQIMFLVTGANKARVVKEIMENEECTLPAALVVKKVRGVWFVLDESAGSLLSQRHK